MLKIGQSERERASREPQIAVAAGQALRPPVIVGHSGDGQPNARMSARYARIRPALSPSFSRSRVNRGE